MLLIAIIIALTVTGASYFAIRYTASRPANGEVKRLEAFDQKAERNLRHFNVVKSQPSNMLHRT